MPDKPRSTWSTAEKAAYRQFVRTHHPDAGGDPEVFRAGLEQFQNVDKPLGTAPAKAPAEKVVFVARRRGVVRLLAVLAARRRRKKRSRVR
ncbi:hypothetical protein VSH64_05610 [Amycolatopsis rhabdoformis]|uniref:J domain-containing protein n=1 Tax=Amycolatopsis rhabdoformis TaxID=1448059 RepID=A0ABZ1IC26_9PSEU|nr:hypothetical protein [Amycolatopsis rhabdoformis]WSE31584.1 hypothetical protein VSH64_05610 [Amycolatopsis rhabdoformis]